ncbi:MAG: hypothetical protein IT193_05710 [Propionibacteriaceae bacterium]|nr:hypothetical protein [Propionibacteriaceae bacterium]
MSGTGKIKGKSARLLAELWIGDTGGGLLTTRILTAKPTSGVAGQAQQMVDQLSGSF